MSESNPNVSLVGLLICLVLSQLYFFWSVWTFLG